MIAVLVLVAGFIFPQSGGDCTEVLHQLRTEHQMEVKTATAVGDTLVYLLESKSHGKGSAKTAQVGCRIVE
jgi:hypothetical protein